MQGYSKRFSGGMLAVDTNVLVRFLTRDDEAQAARARAVIEAGAWIPTTVALELEWVLRGTYRYPPGRVAEVFRMLSGLPTVQFENPDRLSEALSALQAGMDFADALHRAAASGCEAFLTFDLDLIKAAGKTPGAMARLP